MGLFGPKKKSDVPSPSPSPPMPPIITSTSSPSVSSNSRTPKPIVRRPYLHTQATQERLQPPPIHENEIQILNAQVSDLQQCFDNKELFDCLISDVDRNRLTQITMLLAENGDYTKMQSVMDQTELLDKMIADRLTEKREVVRRATPSDSLDKSIDDVIVEISALHLPTLTATDLQSKLSYFEYFLYSFGDAEFDKILTLSAKIEEMRKEYIAKTTTPIIEQDNSMYASFPEPPVIEPTSLSDPSLLFDRVCRLALRTAFADFCQQCETETVKKNAALMFDLVNKVSISHGISLYKEGLEETWFQKYRGLLDTVHLIIMKRALALWSRHVMDEQRTAHASALCNIVSAIAYRRGFELWSAALSDAKQNPDAAAMFDKVCVIANRRGLEFWFGAVFEDSKVRLNATRLFDTVTLIALRRGLELWQGSQARGDLVQKQLSQLDILKHAALSRLMLEWRAIALAQSFYLKQLKLRVIRCFYSETLNTPKSEFAAGVNMHCIRRHMQNWVGLLKHHQAIDLKYRSKLVHQCITAWLHLLDIKRKCVRIQAGLEKKKQMQLLRTAMTQCTRKMNEKDVWVNSRLQKRIITTWSNHLAKENLLLKSKCTLQDRTALNTKKQVALEWIQLSKSRVATRTKCSEFVNKSNSSLLKHVIANWFRRVAICRSQRNHKEIRASQLLTKVLTSWSDVATRQVVEYENLVRMCNMHGLTKIMNSWRQQCIPEKSNCDELVARMNIATKRVAIACWQKATSKTVQRKSFVSRVKYLQLRRVFVAWTQLSKFIHTVVNMHRKRQAMQMWRLQCVTRNPIRQLCGPVISAWHSYTTQLSNRLFSFSLACSDRLLQRFFIAWKRLRRPVVMSSSPILKGWMEVADTRIHKVHAMQEIIRKRRMKDALDYLTDNASRIEPSTPPLPGTRQPGRIEHYYIDDDAQPTKLRTAEDVRRSTEKLIIKTQMFLSRTRLNPSSPTPRSVQKILHTPIALPFVPSSTEHRETSFPEDQYFEQFVSKWKQEEKKWVL